MRQALTVVAILAAGVLLAPGPPFGNIVKTEFPAIDGSEQGSVDIDRLPVVLLDLAGLVDSIEPNDWAVRFHDSEQPFLQLADEPRSIRVFWLGGACAGDVKILLDEGEPDGYVVTLDEGSKLTSLIGCPALGVPRRLTLHLTRPVDPLSFRLEYQPS